MGDAQASADEALGNFDMVHSPSLCWQIPHPQNLRIYFWVCGGCLCGCGVAQQTFYEEFLNKIRDDQLRFDGNHNDTGALADVVPFDGIGGNPGWVVLISAIPRLSLGDAS